MVKLCYNFATALRWHLYLYPFQCFVSLLMIYSIPKAKLFNSNDHIPIMAMIQMI